MNENIMNSIKQNDVISFVGGGGKTTMMFNIAFAAAELGMKVLVTTTTKIFLPEKHFYEQIVLRETISEFSSGKRLGITVYGSRVDNNKIIGLTEKELSKYIESEKFDLVLIEADGSRRKSLKAYKANEPVVPIYSNKVFAVLSLDSIGATIDERYIYNSKKISRILSKNYGSEITEDDIVTFLNSEEGLFENLYWKERYLVLTKCVNKERRDQFNYISEKLRDLAKDIKVYTNY